jgi:terminase small subunit / prophage DNA-packing protein
MTKIDDLTVNAGELAKVLGCGSRTLYAMADEGLVVRRDRGFALAASVSTFVRHLQAARRDDRPSRSDLSVIDELRTQQSLLAAARRKVIEADMIPAEAIAGAWDRILRAVRSAVLAIPGRARFDLPHLSASDAETIGRICRDQLEAAALGDRPPAIDEDA